MAIFELLETSKGFLIIAGLTLGLLVGSFLNVVAYRIPIMLQREWRKQCCETLETTDSSSEYEISSNRYDIFNLYTPASYCYHCNHKIKLWENIPVVSYLSLGGKCSSCKSKISIRYPSIELTTSVLSALVAFTFGPTWLTLALLIFTWSLLVLALIDFDHQLLPDDITIPVLWLGLFVNAVDLGLGVSIHDAVIGAISGYMILWAFYWMFKFATGKEGMGYGDFKLLAVLGAWMGWQTLLPIIALSSLIGALTGILMIIIKEKDRSLPMPFGPYLAGAGFIILIWGPQISGFYITNFVG